MGELLSFVFVAAPEAFFFKELVVSDFESPPLILDSNPLMPFCFEAVVDGAFFDLDSVSCGSTCKALMWGCDTLRPLEGMTGPRGVESEFSLSPPGVRERERSSKS